MIATAVPADDRSDSQRAAGVKPLGVSPGPRISRSSRRDRASSLVGDDFGPCVVAMRHENDVGQGARRRTKRPHPAPHRARPQPQPRRQERVSDRPHQQPQPRAHRRRSRRRLRHLHRQTNQTSRATRQPARAAAEATSAPSTPATPTRPRAGDTPDPRQPSQARNQPHRRRPTAARAKTRQQRMRALTRLAARPPHQQPTHQPSWHSYDQHRRKPEGSTDLAKDRGPLQFKDTQSLAGPTTTRPALFPHAEADDQLLPSADAEPQ